MATHATSKSVICAETEVQMHRIIYHWDIKNFDRICTPENEEFEPISSNAFKAGGEIGRESEWELILSAESGKGGTILRPKCSIIDNLIMRFTLLY